MTDVRIGRLDLHGRVPGAAGDARARLERLAAAACGALLERALDEAGLGGDGELCIRSLDVAALLPLRDGDDTAAAAWSRQVAEAVREAVMAGGAGVVRYGSLAHALADLVVNAARGDLGRAWAWQQLGLWPAGSGVRGVTAALVAQPAPGVCALAEAARRGALTPLLRALPGSDWTAVARAALRALGADAALAEAATSAPDAADTPPPGQESASRDGRAAARQRARRALPSSHLFGAAERAAAFGFARPTCHALAVLALAESDPAALRGPHAAAAVAVLHDTLARHTSRPAREPAQRGSHSQRAPEAAAPARNRGGPRDAGAASGAAEFTASADREQHPRAVLADAAAAARPSRHAEPHEPPDDGVVPRPARATVDDGATSAAHASSDASAGRPTGVGNAAGGGAAHEASRAPDAAGGHAPAPAPARDGALAPPDDEHAPRSNDSALEPLEDAEPPVERQRGATRFGGLLFLLHVVDALGLPDEWSAAGLLAARPLRLVLHRLALTLLRRAGFTGVAGDDPAVLAFAGLRPLAAPPDDGGAPFNEDERQALDDATDRIVATLTQRLSHRAAAPPRAAEARTHAAAADDGGEALDEATDRTAAPPRPRSGERVGVRGPHGRDVLARLLRRRAEIVADPGWFEVHLALGEVDTEVRRVGLDLDPGHVAWLGVVVKLRYA